MWFFALVQRLRSGRVVALRHRVESEAIRGLRGDMIDAWMFRENSEEQLFAELLYAVDGRGVKIVGLGIEQVPHEVLGMLSPPVLIEVPA